MANVGRDDPLVVHVLHMDARNARHEREVPSVQASAGRCVVCGCASAKLLYVSDAIRPRQERARA